MPQRKPRVLLAGPYPPKGEMEGTFGRILRTMQDSPYLGTEVDFIPLRMTVPADGSFGRRYFIDAVRALRGLTVRPDAMHIIMQRQRSLLREVPIIAAARLFGIKVIMDIRTGSLQSDLKAPERQGYQKHLMMAAFRLADKWVMECAHDIRFARSKFGKEAYYLPNIILKSRFEQLVQAKLPPAQNSPLKLIYTGRFHKDKGISEVLDALKIISKQGLKAEYHLAGRGDDAALNAKIQQFAAAPPPGTKVLDHGFVDVDTLYRLLESSHVFTMPTTWSGEGHSYSLNEAMATGLGLILSPWRHLDDLVPDGGAQVTNARSPQSIADAMATFATQPETLKQAGQLNRNRVQTSYLDEARYPGLLELYRKTIR